MDQEPVPGSLGVTGEYTLDGTPVAARCTYTHLHLRVIYCSQYMCTDKFLGGRMKTRQTRGLHTEKLCTDRNHYTSADDTMAIRFKNVIIMQGINVMVS